LFSATRKHEEGVVSNRKSERYGELYLSLAQTARRVSGI